MPKFSPTGTLTARAERMDPGAAIRKELYLTLLLHGADPIVLGTVEAWGDSMDDSEVLKDLRNWNEAKRLELQEWLATLTDQERQAAEQRLRQYQEARGEASARREIFHSRN
jgi:hypothetical protein